MATPIGNLADISLRALHVLSKVDVVACEDTRHTQQLLRAYGLDRPGSQLLAVHQHNEAEAAHNVLERLGQGQRVWVAVDALHTVALRCQPAHVASGTTCHIEHAAARSDQMGPALQPGRRVFGAVHGVHPVKSKARPHLFGQHDDHVGFGIKPESDGQEQGGRDP